MAPSAAGGGARRRVARVLERVVEQVREEPLEPADERALQDVNERLWDMMFYRNHDLGPGGALPNAIAGPAGLVGFGILYALRVGEEERLMLATFGEEYRAYMVRTARLLPGVY